MNITKCLVKPYGKPVNRQARSQVEHALDNAKAQQGKEDPRDKGLIPANIVAVLALLGRSVY